MIPFFTVLLTIFFYLFSGSLFAARYGASLCKNDPQFDCYTVTRGQSWQTLFPDPEQRNIVMKVNRMNTHLYSGIRIAVPKNANASLMDMAPFDQRIEAPGEKIIFVSLQKLAWGAYDPDGNLVNWGPVSGGRGYCPDIGRACHTSLGQFTIYRKEGAGCVSTKFPVGRGGAPMPYCMFFNGGFALHGSYEVPGYNDSHGCVRIFVNDAKWLNQEFVGDDNIPVIVSRQL